MFKTAKQPKSKPGKETAHEPAVAPDVAYLLARAHSSGEITGIDAPEFTFEEDGRTPLKARVAVYRGTGSNSRRFYGEAWREEVEDGGPEWRRRPRQKLAERALAVALELGFPDESLIPYQPWEEVESKGLG